MNSFLNSFYSLTHLADCLVSLCTIHHTEYLKSFEELIFVEGAEEVEDYARGDRWECTRRLSTLRYFYFIHLNVKRTGGNLSWLG